LAWQVKTPIPFFLLLRLKHQDASMQSKTIRNGIAGVRRISTVNCGTGKTNTAAAEATAVSLPKRTMQYYQRVIPVCKAIFYDLLRKRRGLSP
jgi:hypothetical protein